MKAIEVTYRYDGRKTAVAPRPANADAARRRLDEGSRSIGALLDAAAQDGEDVVRRIIPVDPRNLGLAPDVGGAPAQRPYAAVLGCSDARVPIELIFNEGPNDLFVVRVAGNGLGAEGMGSLKYAMDHLGESLKLVVVLGHSGCGAVSAAVDVFLKPSSYLELADQHALRNILDRLLVVVHAAAKHMAVVHGPSVTASPGYRNALVEVSVVSNAALSAYTLQQELSSRGTGDLHATYGVWLLESHRIWAPRVGSDACDGLAVPPAEAGAFARLADAVVKSERIVGLLG